MRKQQSLIILVAMLPIFMTLASAITAQSSETWYGTWRLNLAKSSYNPRTVLRSQVLNIEPSPQGGFTVVIDSVTSRGERTRSESDVRFDDHDYPVKGAEPVIMRRYRRVDDRAFEFVSKTDGKVTTSSKVVISGDGRTQTVTTTGRNPRGIAVNNIAVYEKQ